MGNNAVLGYLMVCAGLALTAGGVAVLTRRTAASSAAIESTARSTGGVSLSVQKTPVKQPLTKDEKGQRFEKWIVKKFNPKYFKIKEWRSDKYVDGVYAESTLNPDLEIEFHMGKILELFAVECKWRKTFDQSQKLGVEWASERQIQNYQKFSKDRGIPVFVVIGIGGLPDDPAELYVIPLDKLKYPFATADYLEKFHRTSTAPDFFFDYKVPELR